MYIYTVAPILLYVRYTIRLVRLKNEKLRGKRGKGTVKIEFYGTVKIGFCDFNGGWSSLPYKAPSFFLVYYCVFRLPEERLQIRSRTLPYIDIFSSGKLRRWGMRNVQGCSWEGIIYSLSQNLSLTSPEGVGKEGQREQNPPFGEC